MQKWTNNTKELVRKGRLEGQKEVHLQAHPTLQNTVFMNQPDSGW